VTPPWLIGLGRVAWYVGLAPLSQLHIILTLLGGGDAPEWVHDAGPVLLIWLFWSAVWVTAAIDLVPYLMGW
jgi:hypothetical protein